MDTLLFFMQLLPASTQSSLCNCMLPRAVLAVGGAVLEKHTFLIYLSFEITSTRDFL